MDVNSFKKRKSNWCPSSTSCLVDRCTESYALINGKLGKGITNKHKLAFWEETTLLINSIGTCNRTGQEVMKKWSELKSKTKLKELKRRNAMKMTGGGPHPPSLELWEEKIINVLSPSLIDGIDGEDTFCTQKDDDNNPVAEMFLTFDTDTGFVVPTVEDFQQSSDSEDTQPVATASTCEPCMPSAKKRKLFSSDSKSASNFQHLFYEEEKRQTEVLTEISSHLKSIAETKKEKLAFLKSNKLDISLI